MIYEERPSPEIAISITLKDDPEVEGIVRIRQVHGKRIVEATGPFDDPPEADGLWTDRSGLAVGIVTADCLPILFWDERRIGAVHAGWRGLASGIIPSFLASGIHPETTRVFIGPAIGPCCYTVREDVARRFPGCVRDGQLDLRKAAVEQMRAAGVKPERIIHLSWCTFCHPSHLPSYRREGAAASRIVNSIQRIASNLPTGPSRI